MHIALGEHFVGQVVFADPNLICSLAGFSNNRNGFFLSMAALPGKAA